MPACLNTLHLTVCDAFAPSPSAGPAIDHLALIAPSLTEFHFKTVTGYRTQPALRGLLDRLVDQLTSVQRLTIPAAAMTNLAASLAPLQHLTELTLRGSHSPHQHNPDPAEVVQLIRAAPSLATLTLCTGLYCDLNTYFDMSPYSIWTTQEKGEINRAAAAKSIDLVWE